MAGMDDVGAAFTGVDPATATQQWDSWLERPGNRAALLQAGLQLMQPVAIGQTVGGHIAQGVGAGAEAATRASDIDLKSQVAESKMAFADEKLRIAQQNADSGAIRAGAAASRATNRKIGGLTDAFRARADEKAQAAFERQLDADARGIEKAVADDKKDILNKGQVREQYSKYAGMTREQIREALRKERPAPKSKYGTSALADSEDDDDDTETPVDRSSEAAAPVAQAPYPGARRAADGNWYVQKDGKYFKVNGK